LPAASTGGSASFGTKFASTPAGDSTKKEEGSAKTTFNFASPASASPLPAASTGGFASFGTKSTSAPAGDSTKKEEESAKTTFNFASPASASPLPAASTGGFTSFGAKPASAPAGDSTEKSITGEATRTFSAVPKLAIHSPSPNKFPVSVSYEDLSSAVHELYERVDPTKVDKVQEIVDKYTIAKTEADLCIQLDMKYGSHLLYRFYPNSFPNGDGLARNIVDKYNKKYDAKGGMKYVLDCIVPKTVPSSTTGPSSASSVSVFPTAVAAGAGTKKSPLLFTGGAGAAGTGAPSSQVTGSAWGNSAGGAAFGGFSSALSSTVPHRPPPAPAAGGGVGFGAGSGFGAAAGGGVAASGGGGFGAASSPASGGVGLCAFS
jgi:hypothetical protein